MRNWFAQQVLGDVVQPRVGLSHVFLVEVDVDVVLFATAAAQPRPNARNLQQNRISL